MERTLRQATLAGAYLFAVLASFIFGFSFSYKNDLVGQSIGYLIKCFALISSYGSHYLRDLYHTAYLKILFWSFDPEYYDSLVTKATGGLLALFSIGIILSLIYFSFFKSKNRA